MLFLSVMEVPRALVDQFMAFTNCDANVAAEQLRSNGLDVETAVANYFAIIEAGGDVSTMNTREVPHNDDVEEVEEVEEVVDNDGEDEVEVQVHEEGGDGNDEVEIVGERRRGVGSGRDGRRLWRGFTRSPPEGLHGDLFVERDEHRPDVTGLFDGVDRDDMMGMMQRFSGRMGVGGVGGVRNGGIRVSGLGNVGMRNGSSVGSGSGSGSGSAAFDRMFRNPTEILFTGSWDQALAEGVRSKKWILINIQDDSDFQCLCLNRDIWNDEGVQELVRAKFLFLQHSSGTRPAESYRQFYPFQKTPHIALIDPRSGERLLVWGEDDKKITKNELVETLVEFVEQHSLEDGRGRPPRRSSAAKTTTATTTDRDLAATEDAQMAAVIAASLETANGVDAGQPGPVSAAEDARRTSNHVSATDNALNEDRSLRAQQDSEYHQSLAMDRAKAESEKLERERLQKAAEREEREMEEQEALRIKKRARVPAKPAHNCTEEVTEIAIRLPNGKRLYRQFFCKNTIGNLYDYIESESDGLKEGTYNLMTPFPRKTYTDRSMTLKDAELHPKAALMIHEL